MSGIVDRGKVQIRMTWVELCRLAEDDRAHPGHTPGQIVRCAVSSLAGGDPAERRRIWHLLGYTPEESGCK